MPCPGCILSCPRNFTNDRSTEAAEAQSCAPGPVSVRATSSPSPTHLLEIHPHIPMLNLFHSPTFFMFKSPCLLHQLFPVLGNHSAEVTHEPFHGPGCRIGTSVTAAAVTGDTGVLVPVATERCSGDKAGTQQHSPSHQRDCSHVHRTDRNIFHQQTWCS